MATYYIKLTFSAPSIDTFYAREVFRLQCVASEAVEMPAEIFCHQRTLVNASENVAQDEFSHIASPYELSIYPADAPAVGQSPAFFRKDTVDILLPGVYKYEEVKTTIEAQVRRLLSLMEKLDVLSESSDVYIPSEPPESSSSES